MNPIPHNAHAGFFGKRRSGKTVRFKHCLRQHRRYIILDLKREDFGDMGVVVRGGVEYLKKALEAGHSRIVYQVAPGEEERVAEADAVATYIYEHLRDFIFAVDEIQAFMSKGKMPRGFALLINVGGGRGHGVWGASQRAQNVHNDFFEQCGVIFAHSSVGRAAETLEEVTAGALRAEELAGLEYFHCLMWSDYEPVGQNVFHLPPVPL